MSVRANGSPDRTADVELRHQQVIDHARTRPFRQRRPLVQFTLQVRITSRQLAFEEFTEQIVEPQHRRHLIDGRQEQIAAIQRLQHLPRVGAAGQRRAQVRIEFDENRTAQHEVLEIGRQLVQHFLREIGEQVSI